MQYMNEIVGNKGSGKVEQQRKQRESRQDLIFPKSLRSSESCNHNTSQFTHAKYNIPYET